MLKPSPELVKAAGGIEMRHGELPSPMEPGLLEKIGMVFSLNMVYILFSALIVASVLSGQPGNQICGYRAIAVAVSVGLAYSAYSTFMGRAKWRRAQDDRVFGIFQPFISALSGSGARWSKRNDAVLFKVAGDDATYLLSYTSLYTVTSKNEKMIQDRGEPRYVTQDVFGYRLERMGRAIGGMTAVLLEWPETGGAKWNGAGPMQSKLESMFPANEVAERLSLRYSPTKTGLNGFERVGDRSYSRFSFMDKASPAVMAEAVGIMKEIAGLVG